MAAIGHLLRQSCAIEPFKECDSYGVPSWDEAGPAITCAAIDQTGKVVRDDRGNDQVINIKFMIGVIGSDGVAIAVDKKDRILYESNHYEIVQIVPKKNIRGIATHYEVFAQTAKR